MVVVFPSISHACARQTLSITHTGCGAEGLGGYHLVPSGRVCVERERERESSLIHKKVWWGPRLPVLRRVVGAFRFPPNPGSVRVTVFVPRKPIKQENCFRWGRMGKEGNERQLFPRALARETTP